MLKAQALRVLAWMTPTSGARDWYLTDARVLEGKLDPALSTLWGSEDRIMGTPMDMLLSLARYHIDPVKSGNTNMTLGVKINNNATSQDGYTLEIRQAVLEFDKGFPANYDVAISTDENSLKRVIAGITTLDKAIEEGKIKVEGSVDDLKKFIGMLDTGIKLSSDISPVSTG